METGNIHGNRGNQTKQRLLQQPVRTIFQKYGVRYAGVFGSTARGTAQKESDVDILIELNKPIGMFALARLRRELSEAIGCEVDLATRNALDARVAPYIESDLELLYEI